MLETISNNNFYLYYLLKQIKKCVLLRERGCLSGYSDTWHTLRKWFTPQWHPNTLDLSEAGWALHITESCSFQVNEPTIASAEGFLQALEQMCVTCLFNWEKIKLLAEQIWINIYVSGNFKV